MMNLLRGLITLSLLLGLGFLQGCATLNETECKAANWEIIGLEDGSSGRATSFIGEHRKACADYGISPDLDAYMKGHKKGLNQYCNYDNGYALGERGGGYNQVCNQRDYAAFYQGYQRGTLAFQHLSEIRQIRSAINSAASRLDEIHHQIKHKEDQIIAEGTPRQLRRDLLEEVKLLNTEASEIGLELPLLEADLYQAEKRYERFRQQR